MFILSFLLFALVVNARVVTVYHNDTSRIRYTPQVCEGVGCGSDCDAWWVTGGPCWSTGEATHSCNKPQASLQFNFTGTSITWLAATYNLGAPAAVFLDGVQQQKVLTFTDAEGFGARVWARSGLSDGQHVLTINCNPQAERGNVQVFAFEYTETDQQPANNTTAIAVGASVGGAAVLVIICLALFFFLRRKRRSHVTSPTPGAQPMAAYTPSPGAAYRPQPLPTHTTGGTNPDYLPTPYAAPASGYPVSLASGYPHSQPSAYQRDTQYSDTPYSIPNHTQSTYGGANLSHTNYGDISSSGILTASEHHKQRYAAPPQSMYAGGNPATGSGHQLLASSIAYARSNAPSSEAPTSPSMTAADPQGIMSPILPAYSEVGGSGGGQLLASTAPVNEKRRRNDGWPAS